MPSLRKSAKTVSCLFHDPLMLCIHTKYRQEFHPSISVLR